jgi:hypothetical protein
MFKVAQLGKMKIISSFTYIITKPKKNGITGLGHGITLSMNHLFVSVVKLNSARLNMGIYGKTVLLPVPGYSGIRDFFCHNFCLQ